VAHNVDKKALRGIVGCKGLVPVHIVPAGHLSSLCTVAASPHQAMQKQIQKKAGGKALLYVPWPAPSCVLRALLWYR
jgi:hypothetical protein